MLKRKPYDPSEDVKKMREVADFLGSIMKTYENNYAEVGRHDKMLIEYAHEIELLELGPYDLLARSKEFKEMRRIRREHKNQNIMLTHLHQTLLKYPASLIDDLRKCATKMEDTEKYLKTRVYNRYSDGAKIMNGQFLEDFD